MAKKFSPAKTQTKTQTYDVTNPWGVKNPPTVPKGFPSQIVEQLPIYSYLPHVLRNVNEYERSCVKAATGVGKSLGIPFYLAHKTGARVCVSVPTRAAAHALYNRMTEIIIQAGVDLTVGYAAEGEVHYDFNTKIVYGTAGHWNRKLQGLYSVRKTWPNINFCDVFICDEIHTGDVDTSLICLLLDDAQRKGIKIPKIIYASATFDLEKYPYPSVDVPIKSHPVEIKYDESEIDRNEIVQWIVSKVNLLLTTTTGDILVFCAGAEDVESVLDNFRNIEGLRALPAYSALKKEEIDLIFTSSTDRTLIVATNIAESSITIPYIAIVIDSMMEKRAGTSMMGGSSLVLSLISKNSADQRKGRTGRNCPGVCYRMCSKAFFDQLETERPLEISRVPLYNILLSLFASGFDPIEILSSTVDIESLRNEIKLLKTLELIVGYDDSYHCDRQVSDFESYYEFSKYYEQDKLKSIKNSIKAVRVTEMGSFVHKFSLSAKLGVVMYKWLMNNPGHNAYACIVILSIIESYGPSYLWFPRKMGNEKPHEYTFRMKEYVDDHFADFIGETDLETYTNVWVAYLNYCPFMPDMNTMKRFSRINSLNFKKMWELNHTIRRCIKSLSYLKLPFTISYVTESFDSAEMISEMRPYFLSPFKENLLTFVGIRKNRHYYARDRISPNLSLDMRNPTSTLTTKGAGCMMKVIALITAEIRGASSTFLTISLAI